MDAVLRFSEIENIIGGLSVCGSPDRTCVPQGAYAGFRDRLSAVTASVARTIRALAYISLQFGVIELRIVSQKASLNTV